MANSRYATESSRWVAVLVRLRVSESSPASRILAVSSSMEKATGTQEKEMFVVPGASHIKTCYEPTSVSRREWHGRFYFYPFFKNSLGVRPKCFLNVRVKCWGYSKPRRSEVSVMVLPSRR